jgi:hypothetical protein
MALSARVQVSPRFQRAIRIDTDLQNPQALEGFICPQSATEILLNMGRHVAETGQAAFTWTGPYGSGKSSLVIALSALLGGNARRRARAAQIIGQKSARQLWELLPPRTKGWQILPVVGRRESPVCVLGEALKNSGLVARQPRGGWTESSLLEAITAIRSEGARLQGGLIIVVDEMGKFLEHAAAEGSDIYLFQQLAELASRSDGRLILIGVLHQAFEEYAHRLGREQRDEWAKVQGRFIDLLINIAGEEQLELLSRAIQSDHKHRKPGHTALQVAGCISANRRGNKSNLSAVLERCWPLHPVTAALLGAISRRRFGQNQRSLFGFLNSMEPHGFQVFLRNGGHAATTYTPDMLWDYLRANLEPSILASPDGHRWSLAVDAIERCEGVGGNELHMQLLKSLALIDLFKERSGLAATPQILSTCAAQHSAPLVKRALDQMIHWSIAIFKRHLGAYAVFAGSDFDIDEALREALEEIRVIDFRTLRALAGMQPIIAKRHYHAKGALRWFDVDLVPLKDLASYPVQKHRQQGAIGVFLVPIPTEYETASQLQLSCREAVAGEHGKYLIVGHSPQAQRIVELARELLALARIQEERIELAGDAVARREVLARLAEVREQLEHKLRQVLETATWYRRSAAERNYSSAELSGLASHLSDDWYPLAPRISNELLNRIQPSANAIAGQNALLKAMVLKQREPRLGIDGYPAEGGLFASLLDATGLYQKTSDGWRFVAPTHNGHDPAVLGPLWAVADKLLKDSGKSAVGIQELHGIWQSEPYGVKQGLLPVLTLAYTLSRSGQIAFYRQGIFQSRLTDLDAEYFVHDPGTIQLRWLDLSSMSQRLLLGMAEIVRELDPTRTCIGVEPLDIARALVAIYEGFDSWTKRTMHLSPVALKIRNIFKQASDPHRFLFDDLPNLLATPNALDSEDSVTATVETVLAGLSELHKSYHIMLANLEALLFKELHASIELPDGPRALRARAENIRHVSGDLRFNAFVARLAQYEGTDRDIEGLVSLAINKPPREWTDPDVDQAGLELAKFAQAFIQTEAFARVKGRRDTQHAMAVVVGLDGQPTPLAQEFLVADEDRSEVHSLIALVDTALAQADTRQKHLILAALAEISARYMTDRESSLPAKKRVAVP